MKHFLLAAAMAATAIPVFAADVGVSISVGQPGFYGQIDIGDFPQPRFLYPQPIIIRPAPVGVILPPIYLHVPPGHARNWRKHCYKYNACGQPVYFVEESWYNDVYVPRYREHHNDWDEHDEGHDRGRGGHGRGGGGHGRGHGKD
jgi:hypothetical protein